MKKVFVYGSLLSGMGNHGLLASSAFLGEARSPKGFAMIDLGYFPGAFSNDSDEDDILGEVYEVDNDTFQRLDWLEGYNETEPTRGMYDRTLIPTPYGEAYIYLYNSAGRFSSSTVEDGDWKTHFRSKRARRDDY